MKASSRSASRPATDTAPTKVDLEDVAALPAGEQLLLSKSFADGKSAGMINKRLQSGEPLDVRVEGQVFAVWIDSERVASSPEFADGQALEDAIARLREALAPQE